MYDKTGLLLRKEQAPGINLITHGQKYLSDIEESYSSLYNKYFIKGNLGNLRVWIDEDKVSIRNRSICKFYYGDNIKTLGVNETREVFMKISDHLHLPMHLAKIEKFEFGTNIFLDYPIEVYLPYLGEYGHFKRLEHPNGLYYKVNSKMLCFYNKIIELKDHRQFVPDYLKDKYLLRYEIRYLKGLNKEFNRELIANQLYDEAFFELLVERWKLSYFKIKKVNNMIMKLKPTGSKIEFRNNLALLALLSEGQSAIIKQINEWQALGDITKKQAFDLRQLTKSLGEKTLIERNSLIDELSEKIENYNPY